MKLRLEQLDNALRKGLAPFYLISGEEPQQLGEALDKIREAARAAGYGNRELLYADASFDWNTLAETSHSYSMFDDRRVIDLRLSAKPDKVGAATLQDYAERPPEDAILIVSLPVKLTPDDQKKNRWFQLLEQKGVFIQVWPLEGQEFIQWLDRRITAKNMIIEHSGLLLIAARTEGNLLAAAQEIEKLHILYGPVRLDDDMVRKAVTNSARYDVFDLTEAALKGQPSRVVRILHGLRAEGIASPVALWALARELRVIASVQAQMATGTPLDAALAKLRIWDKQKPAMSAAVKRLPPGHPEHLLLRCARADRMIKGQQVGDDWDELLEIGLGVAGKPY